MIFFFHTFCNKIWRMAVLLSKVLGCPKPRNVHCMCDINMFVAIPTNDKDWLAFGEGLNFK